MESISGSVSNSANINPYLACKYKNIVFDVGAVLVRWNPEELLTEMMSMISKDLLKLLISTDVMLDRGALKQDDFIDLLTQRLGRFMSKNIFNCMVNHLEPLPAGVAIFNEIKALGYKTYILSNMSEPAFKKISTENDFVNQVDGAIWSYQVKTVKPEPEIYRKLISTYKLDPKECLFIDDREENIKAAKREGIDGIICTNHEHVRQELSRLKVI